LVFDVCWTIAKDSVILLYSNAYLIRQELKKIALAFSTSKKGTGRSIEIKPLIDGDFLRGLYLLRLVN